MMMVKFSNETLRKVTTLPKAKREKVEAIVRRHVKACERNGFFPESMERAYIEAIEMVELEERSPDLTTQEMRNWEPLRRYDQYISPTAI